MKKSWIAVALGVTSLVATALAMSAPNASAATAALHPAHVCKAVLAKGEATCHALKMVNDKGMSPASTSPPGTALTAAQVRAAYGLTTNSGGRTVAIVDAYGYTNLASDLATYRSTMGLSACGSGCLTIMNQSGGTSLPAMDVGWAQEQALDVDAVSAACPDCKILVVQANSASLADLGAAVNTAAKQAGVVAISNSYGGSDLSDATYGAAYHHSGIAITASTGDNGYKGASFPASSAFVTAVGGTSLKMSGLSRVSETVWSGAGSGCSSYNAAVAPSSFGTGCARRAMADVSAAADPNTGGLAVYYPTTASSSTWGQFGGTSESSPIIASVYALAGGGYSNTAPYTQGTSANLHDVTSGSNARHCPVSQWCKARTGWDGPTGLGTPNGVGAF